MNSMYAKVSTDYNDIVEYLDNFFLIFIYILLLYKNIKSNNQIR